MPTAQNGFYEVATGERAVYVRVHGLASMTNCLCLRAFVEEMLESGRRFVVVDLADCAGMDSTFMGVLAGVATYEREGRNADVVAVNVSEAMLRLLRNVGLTELIFIEPNPLPTPDLEFVRLEDRRNDGDRMALVCAAHENLIKISGRNEETFGPLVAALEVEMKQRGIRSSD